MKITFTNAYGNKNNIEKKEIEIEGNCVITNYDPTNHTPSGAGDLTITINGEKSSVKKGATVFQRDSSTVNLNSRKYSIFTAIAELDGDGNNLTEEDLEKANNFIKGNKKWNFLSNLMVTEINYDKKTGIATIKIGENEILRIDFETQNEVEKNQTSKTKPIQTNAKQTNEVKTNTSKSTTSNTQEVKNKTTQKTDTTKITSTSVNLNNNIDYIEVKEEWIPYIQDLAKTSGYSEDLIISLVLNENFTQKAVHKKENGGLNEVGFGHTTQAKSNNDFEEGYEIDLKTAFEWLGQDIKDCENAIKKFGSYYDYNNLPRPMQEAIIDIAFNRGINKLNPKSKYFDKNYQSVHANIELGYIGSAAVRLRQEKFSNQKVEAGLRKRNVIRFLKVIKDLEPDKIVKAMDLFNREEYYTKALNMAKGAEKNNLKTVWVSTYNNAKDACE